MSDFKAINISSEAEFLAHMLALKNESEERLQTLADCLYAHNNSRAAEVFQQLANDLAESIRLLEDKAAGIELPNIPPWEYQWHCSNNPEALCMDHAHYLMSMRQALELALFNEQRGLAFLQRIHDEVADESIRALSSDQIDIEQRFAERLREWMLGLPEDEAMCDDLDPPHMPE